MTCKTKFLQRNLVDTFVMPDMEPQYAYDILWKILFTQKGLRNFI
jgi:hypothetical protein